MLMTAGRIGLTLATLALLGAGIWGYMTLRHTPGQPPLRATLVWAYIQPEQIQTT